MELQQFLLFSMHMCTHVNMQYECERNDLNLHYVELSNLGRDSARLDIWSYATAETRDTHS